MQQLVKISILHHAPGMHFFRKAIHFELLFSNCDRKDSYQTMYGHSIDKNSTVHRSVYKVSFFFFFFLFFFQDSDIQFPGYMCIIIRSQHE